MFKNVPLVISHKAAVRDDNNFITEKYIVTSNKGTINVLNRLCPHRLYPIGEIGPSKNIICKFHGFEFNKDGSPVNNTRHMNCYDVKIDDTGLITKNFHMPKNKQWVNDLKNENNLHYSHSYTGHSEGSYLWQMEAEADLLHVRPGGIHPWLSKEISIKDVTMDNGEDWIVQTHPDGWWLYIFPYTFVEWSPGCLAINIMTPKNKDSEFGFSWITQIYFDPKTNTKDREYFENIESVWLEDIITIEKIKTPFFPLINSKNALEQHCIIWGQWVTNHKLKVNKL